MYTKEIRNESIKLYQNGMTVNNICSRFGMARSTLLLWLKESRPDKRGQIPREIYLMQKELDRLRLENQIFRESGCSPLSPLHIRIETIKRLSENYSIHMLCRILQVQRSTYYHHMLRSPEKTQLQIEDEQLRPIIKEIFKKSGQRFGARKIRVKLTEMGHTISKRRILRLMKELNLSAKGRQPRLNSANDRQYQYCPNKLKRNFLTDFPNKIWISDITYAKVGMDFLYLCVIIDLYSRKVIGYEISETIDTALVMAAFHDALAHRDCLPGLIFHSDQGTQYTSYEFRSYLRELGILQSFSAPGSPYDNAVAESFFASIKKEDFRRNYYTTENEFRKAVGAYIDFYNSYRPHQSLGFLTPDQAEEQYQRR